MHYLHDALPIWFLSEIPSELVDWKRAESATAQYRTRSSWQSDADSGWGGPVIGAGRGGRVETRHIPPSPPVSGKADGVIPDLKVGDNVKLDSYCIVNVIDIVGWGRQTISES